MKFYNSNIIELPDNSLGDYCSVENDIFFRQSDNIRSIDGLTTSYVLNLKGLSCVVPTNDGVWCIDKENSTFFNSVSKKISNECDISLSKACFFKEYIVTCDYFTNQTNTVLLDKDKDREIIGPSCSNVKISNDFIYIKSFDEEDSKELLLCLDLNLEQVWKNVLEKSFFSLYVTSNIFLHDNLIILNLGFDPFKHDDFEIVSYYQETGLLKWNKILDQVPAFASLINFKFYIYNAGILTVLNPSNGEETLSKHSGFKNSVPKDGYESVTIYASEHSIYIFDMWNHAIRIFNHDMEFQQEIVLPKPDTKHCFGYFQPNISTNIIEKDNSIYCFLSYYTGLGAVLILTPSETDTPTITIKKRPEFILENIDTDQPGHGYKLSISSNDLDEVLTAGEYELMELCQYRGHDRSEHDHFDPELNETIIYCVDITELPDNAEEELQKMASSVEEFLETFLVTAPKTDEEFKIIIEIQ